MFETLIEEMKDFLEKSPSAFHAVRELENRLVADGYQALSERDHWNLKAGEKYFVSRNSSALLAFRVPQSTCRSLHIAAAHIDSPAFKVKPNPELAGSGGTVRLNIEKYGGMLTAPWFDRPLTVAGRILVEENGGLREKLVFLDRDLLIIPSLAIHMDREANEKAHGNIQKEMLPLFALNENDIEGSLMSVIAEEADVPVQKILGADLYLTTRMKPSIWGMKREFISAQRLDNLSGCYCAFRGFLASEDSRSKELPGTGIMPMLCIFDNEEVGSRTRQGAESDFLISALERIAEDLGMTKEEQFMLQANSFMISSDNAHAVHPNYPDKADPVNRPQMNKGIVLKHHAGYKYTTDGISAAVIRSLCSRHQIPLQEFTNRSDMTSGSTLGNISSTKVSIHTADIGLAQLSMHSCYETAGTKDPADMAALMTYFFQENLPAIRTDFS